MLAETKYIHLRYHLFFNKEQHINNHGGVTIAYRRFPTEFQWTFASCRWNENFNKKLGRTITDGRFKKDMYFRCACTETDPTSALIENKVLPHIYEKTAPKSPFYDVNDLHAVLF